MLKIIVTSNTLTDQSMTFDVVLKMDGNDIILPATSAAAAANLATIISDAVQLHGLTEVECRI